MDSSQVKCTRDLQTESGNATPEKTFGINIQTSTPKTQNIDMAHMLFKKLFSSNSPKEKAYSKTNVEQEPMNSDGSFTEDGIINALLSRKKLVSDESSVESECNEVFEYFLTSCLLDTDWDRIEGNLKNYLTINKLELSLVDALRVIRQLEHGAVRQRLKRIVLSYHDAETVLKVVKSQLSTEPNCESVESTVNAEKESPNGNIGDVPKEINLEGETLIDDVADTVNSATSVPSIGNNVNNTRNTKPSSKSRHTESPESDTSSFDGTNENETRRMSRRIARDPFDEHRRRSQRIISHPPGYFQTERPCTTIYLEEVPEKLKCFLTKEHESLSPPLKLAEKKKKGDIGNESTKSATSANTSNLDDTNNKENRRHSQEVYPHSSREESEQKNEETTKSGTKMNVNKREAATDQNENILGQQIRAKDLSLQELNSYTHTEMERPCTTIYLQKVPEKLKPFVSKERESLSTPLKVAEKKKKGDIGNESTKSATSANTSNLDDTNKKGNRRHSQEVYPHSSHEESEQKNKETSESGTKMNVNKRKVATDQNENILGQQIGAKDLSFKEFKSYIRTGDVQKEINLEGKTTIDDVADIVDSATAVASINNIVNNNRNTMAWSKSIGEVPKEINFEGETPIDDVGDTVNSATSVPSIRNNVNNTRNTKPWSKSKTELPCATIYVEQLPEKLHFETKKRKSLPTPLNVSEKKKKNADIGNESTKSATAASTSNLDDANDKTELPCTTIYVEQLPEKLHFETKKRKSSSTPLKVSEKKKKKADIGNESTKSATAASTSNLNDVNDKTELPCTTIYVEQLPEKLHFETKKPKSLSTLKVSEKKKKDADIGNESAKSATAASTSNLDDANDKTELPCTTICVEQLPEKLQNFETKKRKFLSTPLKVSEKKKKEADIGNESTKSATSASTSSLDDTNDKENRRHSQEVYPHHSHEESEQKQKETNQSGTKMNVHKRKVANDQNENILGRQIGAKVLSFKEFKSYIRTGQCTKRRSRKSAPNFPLPDTPNKEDENRRKSARLSSHPPGYFQTKSPVTKYYIYCPDRNEEDIIVEPKKKSTAKGSRKLYFGDI